MRFQIVNTQVSLSFMDPETELCVVVNYKMGDTKHSASVWPYEFPDLVKHYVKDVDSSEGSRTAVIMDTARACLFKYMETLPEGIPNVKIS